MKLPVLNLVPMLMNYETSQTLMGVEKVATCRFLSQQGNTCGKKSLQVGNWPDK